MKALHFLAGLPLTCGRPARLAQASSPAHRQTSALLASHCITSIFTQPSGSTKGVAGECFGSVLFSSQNTAVSVILVSFFLFDYRCSMQ